LYYFFSFEDLTTKEAAVVNSSNTFPDDNPGYTEYDSGLMVIFGGYSLPFKAYKSVASAESSAFAEGSTTFFTYAP
jgi:hypothetical protein